MLTCNSCLLYVSEICGCTPSLSLVCRIMRNYMPKVGTLGHDMMFRSTTIQVCLRYFCVLTQANLCFLFFNSLLLQLTITHHRSRLGCIQASAGRACGYATCCFKLPASSLHTVSFASLATDAAHVQYAEVYDFERLQAQLLKSPSTTLFAMVTAAAVIAVTTTSSSLLVTSSHCSSHVCWDICMQQPSLLQQLIRTIFLL